MRERGNVIVGDIMRRLFQRIENKFKAGIVAARDGDAAEIFQKSGEQSGGFRCGFLFRRLGWSPPPLPRNPVPADAFDSGWTHIYAPATQPPPPPTPHA